MIELFKEMIDMVIPSFKFPFYAVMILSSIIIGCLYIFFSLRKEKMKVKEIFLFFLLLTISALMFGKFFTMVTDHGTKDFLKVGFSSYGGLIGVIFAAICFEFIVPSEKKIIKYSILSLPLIYSISKIGCTIVGCCGGIPYDGFLAVTYSAKQNISQFPIQALEVISFMILFLILNKLKNKKSIIYITIVSCAILKFLLDFLRYEHVNKLFSVNQIFSIILVVITIIVWIIVKRKSVKD